MKTTIIIACHKPYLKYLDTAIKSALNQSVKCDVRVEYDGDLADIFPFLDTYSVGTFSLHNAKKVSTLVNKAVKYVKTKYFMRLDADDWLDKDCVLFMEALMEYRKDIGAVCSAYHEVDEEVQAVYKVEQGDYPHPACMLIRKSVFDSLGGYNEELKRQEGQDFITRFIAAGRKYEVISQPLWYRRKHNHNMSNTHNDAIKTRYKISDDIPKILCVIPARGNSKGIPRKNMIRINGVPLVGHAIRLAKASSYPLYIVVSTEDSEIAEYARSQGVEVWDRPEKLSEDDVSIIPVAKDVLERHEIRFDYVVTLQPTSPLTPVAKLDDGLRMIIADGAGSVVSVAELSKHPYRSYEMDRDNFLRPYFPQAAEKYLQRQDRPKAYGFTGGFYIRKACLLKDWQGKGFALGFCYGVDVTRRYGIDIDDDVDLAVAKALANEM